jgi:hypothetical protein
MKRNTWRTLSLMPGLAALLLLVCPRDAAPETAPASAEPGPPAVALPQGVKTVWDLERRMPTGTTVACASV